MLCCGWREWKASCAMKMGRNVESGALLDKDPPHTVISVYPLPGSLLRAQLVASRCSAQIPVAELYCASLTSAQVMLNTPAQL